MGKKSLTVAVYTIVKNAESYIDKWIESAQDADYLILGDTGSTDRTVAVARKHGATVYKIKPETPFHFGNARNALLDKVPDVDICVSLDADEVLAEGWRETLESEWRGRYMAIHHIQPSGRDTLAIRIHPRNAKWRDSIHETLDIGDTVPQKSSIVFIHNKDLARSRDFYMDLLLAELEVERQPRFLALMGKELYVRNRTDEAIEYFDEYLKSDTPYMEERASVCNILYYITKDIKWPYTSIWYCPLQQEAYQRIAVYMAHNSDWLGAYHFMKMGLEYQPLGLFVEHNLTEEACYAILAEGAHQTGNHSEAVEIGLWLTTIYGDTHEPNYRRYQGG
jgi:glycosyltransferase involved in cell wall biosynthesis